MKQRLFLIALCLLFSVHASYSQELWETIKEKAQDAWNSDLRKNAWEKTKGAAQKVMDSDIIESKKYKVPVTNRKFVNIIPDDYLLSMSEEFYQSVSSSPNLSSQATEKKRVQRVAQKLSKAVEKFYQDQGMAGELKNFHWEFNLIKGTTVNAFCMPGGKIAVYEGMMPVASDDASLAIVIGHEIAHAIAKHSAEQMTKGLASTVGLTAIILAISGSDMSDTKKILSRAIASAGISLAELKFSRQNETEADRIGLILAAMAGYNPETAITFWEKMKEHSVNQSDHDWYSTHPSNTNRIESIREFLPEAKQYYNE